MSTQLEQLFRAIASGREAEVSHLLKATPSLALGVTPVGASRKTSTPYFLREIGHHVYAGDTALHIAAAGYRAGIARELIAHGADAGARNRRGAEPLHYASDGGPGSQYWNPEGQAAIVEYLIRAGANPNAKNKNGVAPLHRAVRTRCAAAVRALLAHGAEPRRRNASGSTPLHLAVQNTGRGGSGAAEAKAQQAEIIRLLMAHGARLTDQDDRGKTVSQCIASEWIRELVQR